MFFSFDSVVFVPAAGPSGNARLSPATFKKTIKKGVRKNSPKVIYCRVKRKLFCGLLGGGLGRFGRLGGAFLGSGLLGRSLLLGRSGLLLRSGGFGGSYGLGGAVPAAALFFAPERLRRVLGFSAAFTSFV